MRLLRVVLATIVAAAASKKGLSDQVLWGGATKIAELVWTSPFVEQACSGELDALQFGQYMAQDIGCYMPGAIKVLHGLHERSLKEQGPNSNMTTYFAQMQSGYVSYLAAEAKGWDLGSIKCSSSGQAYVDFLQEVAEKESLAQAIIAFAPCTVLWDWLGGRMKSCIRPGNAYNDWIKRLAGGKSADFTLIDSLVHQALISQPGLSVETFRAAMMKEYDFFNSVIPNFTAKTNPSASATVAILQDQTGPRFMSFLGVAYLMTLTWARVATGAQKVMNPEVQEALLK